MTDIHDRLRQARIAAGFETMSDAARHFGWPISTYGGHENGTRGIKKPDLLKYAQAFDVSADWLFTGRSATPQAAKAPSPAPGFSEPATIPFTGRSDTERRAFMALADSAEIKPRHASLFQLTRDVPGLMLLKGDVLIVDLKPTPLDGQVVLIQSPDPATGEASTELARMHNGHPVPAYGTTVNTEGAAIMGAVITTIRPTRAA